MFFSTTVSPQTAPFLLMAQSRNTGLGLGLPHARPSRNGEEISRHERSHSLYDPSYTYFSPKGRHRTRSENSGEPTQHSVESIRAMAELNAAAATVVGTVARPKRTEAVDNVATSRNFSSSTNEDKELGDTSISRLRLARVRARSEMGVDDLEDASDPRLPSGFPRADSLLRLDSKTTSKDLKKLLTTRVRRAPTVIDVARANLGGTSSSLTSPVKNDPPSSLLEPEKSRPRIEVYLVLNNSVAVEGGSFGGTLFVRSRKPRRGEARQVRIDGGKVRIIGYEGVSEAERYAFYQSSTPLLQVSKVCEQLYDSAPSDDGFRIAKEGTFSLPFIVHIPYCDLSRPHKNVPKGIIQDHSINATIRYIFLVSFKVRDDADNKSGIDKHANLGNISIAHFYREVELWPSYGPMSLHNPDEVHPAFGTTGTVSARSAQGLFFGGAGMLHLTAVLHRKVWLAGQKCVVYIGAWNETKKSIKTVTLSIMRKAVISRPDHGPSTSSKQIAETTLDAARGPIFGPVTGKGWWAGIEPGATCEFSHSIDIPLGALTVPRTHVLEVAYVLRVTLVTGSLSANMSVDLPFHIINTISIDGLPIPPPPGLLVGGLKLPKEVPVSFTFENLPIHKPDDLDQRTWNIPGDVLARRSGLQERDILEWARHSTDLQSYDSHLESRSSEENKDPSRMSRISQDTNCSRQAFDDVAPGESMSRLMSELESDLSIQESTASQYSSQRNSIIGPSTSKLDPSAKHRVTFLTPKTAAAQIMPKDSITSGEPGRSDTRGSSGHWKEPSLRWSSSKRPTHIQPSQHLRYATDMWSEDDADEVLRSIPLDGARFDSGQGQELEYPDRAFGPITSSSMSSDPWSAGGSTFSQHNMDHQGTDVETSPEQYGGPSYSRPYSIKSTFEPQAISASKDDTPRAGVVSRFQPEIVAGGIHASSSRATIVPTISSPMLAKSQSAYVVGSPVNQYRRFSPQLLANAQLPSDSSRGAIDESTIRGVAGPRTGVLASESSRNSVLLPSSSSTLTVVPDAKAHLRSRSGPEMRGRPASSAILSKSTVRSRIAALEERSRSLPTSQSMLPK